VRLGFRYRGTFGFGSGLSSARFGRLQSGLAGGWAPLARIRIGRSMLFSAASSSVRRSASNSVDCSPGVRSRHSPIRKPAIESGPMLRRPDLVLQLRVKTRGRYDVETRAFAARQRQMMAAGRSAAEGGR